MVKCKTRCFLLNKKWFAWNIKSYCSRFRKRSPLHSILAFNIYFQLWSFCTSLYFFINLNYHKRFWQKKKKTWIGNCKSLFPEKNCVWSSKQISPIRKNQVSKYSNKTFDLCIWKTCLSQDKTLYLYSYLCFCCRSQIIQLFSMISNGPSNISSQQQRERHKLSNFYKHNYSCWSIHL